VSTHSSLGFDGLEVIYRIAHLLSSAGPLEGILRGVLQAMADGAGLSRGMISILTPEEDELAVDVSLGLTEQAKRKGKYRQGEGITGKVVATGKPVAVPRLSEEPLFLDRTGARRDLSREDLAFLCVPIRTGTQIIGALSADRATTDQSMVLSEELRFLESVAALIAQTVLGRRREEERRAALERENRRLKAVLSGQEQPMEWIGNSKVMRQVFQQIIRVASSDTTVLVRGETGTGKELVARAIHQRSPRKDHPYIAVNCAALSETLLESELFGHEEGAFTGASKHRIGCFEAASSGTIFLDEVGEFAPAAQTKLLRVLQEKEIQRIGASKPIHVDVRVIAATNRDLEKDIEQGHFRRDLYYRLNVFPIALPPLSDRGTDVLDLMDHFVRKHSRRLGKTIDKVCEFAKDVVTAYDWPGNVRELENCVERAVLLSEEQTLHAYHFPPSLQQSIHPDMPRTGSLTELVENYERSLILEALLDCQGNQSEAARLLKSTKRMIQYKVKKYGIDWEKMKDEA